MKRSGFQKPLMVVVVSAIAFVNFGFFKGLTDVAKKATGVLENAGGEVKGNNAQGYNTAELEDFCRRQGVDPATVKEGDVATFKVVATGSGLSYQWQYSKDSGLTWNTSTVNSATYGTTATAVRNGWLYRCIVTDGSGDSVMSQNAKLTIF